MSDPRTRTSGRGRIRGALLLAAAAGMLLPLVAEATPPQEETRRKQLEVLEELLSENVQEYVNERVAAEIRKGSEVDLDDDGEADFTSPTPMVVRTGSIGRAHGVFIAGYGVIFSLQIPQVGVLPHHFAQRLTPSRFPAWERLPAEETAESLQRVTARMVEGRTRGMEQQLRALEALLRQQFEEGERNELVERQLTQIVELRKRFDSLSAEIDESSEVTPEAPEPHAEAPEVEAEEPQAEAPERPREPEAWVFSRDLFDDKARMSELLDKSRERTAEAVTEATVDTLANFGSVIKGLDEEDRISVVIVPSVSWFAREHQDGHGREEFVVTVRYGDIRDLDDGRIAADEFRSRVQVHNRLGTAIEPGRR